MREWRVFAEPVTFYVALAIRLLMKYSFQFIVCEASEIIDLPIVLYTEIIILSGRPAMPPRGSARGSYI